MRTLRCSRQFERVVEIKKRIDLKVFNFAIGGEIGHNAFRQFRPARFRIFQPIGVARENSGVPQAQGHYQLAVAMVAARSEHGAIVQEALPDLPVILFDVEFCVTP